MQEQYTEIWQEYEQGLDYLNRLQLFFRTEKCHNFINGDQWEGLKSGKDRPAQLNVLAPIMKTNTSLVGQNLMSIHYSSMNYDSNREQYINICKKLDQQAQRTWEALKLDKYCWNILQDAYIAGDAIVYFYDQGGNVQMDLVDNVNIMFGDEQNPNIQEQPYLLMIQRRYVDEVRKEAEENGIDPSEIERIVDDDSTDLQINGKVEVDNHKKLTSIMKLWKEDGTLCVARSTKTVLYQPKTKIAGMSMYPVAKYTWKPKKGSARGLGDIWDKIPNQISINKNLYRFETAVKSSAYPHKVYRKEALSREEIDKLSFPDSNIAVSDPMNQGIQNLVMYLQPASISPYAKDIWQETLVMTRELAGAGDNLENINPENTSGASINAARDAKAINVNMQVAEYKQFIEDIARIWFALWVAYNPNGLSVVMRTQDGEEYEEQIDAQLLSDLLVDVRIDVSPNNPYSKLAHEAGLKGLLDAGQISFEEYVEALDENSSMPKGKLKEIMKKRIAVQQLAQKMQSPESIGLSQNNDSVPQESQDISTLQNEEFAAPMGGNTNVL